MDTALQKIKLVLCFEREGEAATVRAHHPHTTQHEYHPPPAAEAAGAAAAPGQNMGGAVKKGQAARAD
eukprot:1153431-Pelagomonas_calceolata.AAC.2